MNGDDVFINAIVTTTGESSNEKEEISLMFLKDKTLEELEQMWVTPAIVFKIPVFSPHLTWKQFSDMHANLHFRYENLTGIHGRIGFYSQFNKHWTLGELIAILTYFYEELKLHETVMINPSKNPGKEKRLTELKLTEYLTLKLEKKETNIYIKGKKFKQCKYLLLNMDLSSEKEKDLQASIESIDDAAKKLSRRHELEKFVITPEEEFFGHCSNLQAWIEHDYDRRLLHSNLAKPLFKALMEAGDPKARMLHEEELFNLLNALDFDHVMAIEDEFTPQFLHDYCSIEERKMFLELFLEKGVLKAILTHYNCLSMVEKKKFNLSMTHPEVYLEESGFHQRITHHLENVAHFSYQIKAVILPLLSILIKNGDEHAKDLLFTFMRQCFERDDINYMDHFTKQGYMDVLTIEEVEALLLMRKKSLEHSSWVILNTFYQDETIRRHAIPKNCWVECVSLKDLCAAIKDHVKKFKRKDRKMNLMVDLKGALIIRAITTEKNGREGDIMCFTPHALRSLKHGKEPKYIQKYKLEVK